MNGGPICAQTPEVSAAEEKHIDDTHMDKIKKLGAILKNMTSL